MKKARGEAGLEFPGVLIKPKCNQYPKDEYTPPLSFGGEKVTSLHIWIMGTRTTPGIGV